MYFNLNTFLSGYFTRKVGCEDDTLNLNCPRQTKIFLGYTFFGKKRKNVLVLIFSLVLIQLQKVTFFTNVFFVAYNVTFE